MPTGHGEKQEKFHGVNFPALDIGTAKGF
jgi:hypothetical protein